MEEAMYVAEKSPEYLVMPEQGKATIPIHEAKSNLSKLVKRAAAGETIYIGAYGRPEAVMVSPAALAPPLKRPVNEAFGCMKGKIHLPEGWDDPLPDDIIDSFYNSKGLEEFEPK